jgi:hypothetical protein
MKVLEALGGRKFVLVIVFTIVVLVNALAKVGLSWQELLVLAGMYGVYEGANAYSAPKTNTMESIYYSTSPAFEPVEATE